MAKKSRTKRRSVSVKVAKRRKSTRRRKRGLSEGLSQAFNPATVQSVGKAMLSGAVGGAIGQIIQNKLTSGKPLMQKLVILGGASFLFGAILKMPNVGAGIASTIGADLLASKGMAENNADFLADLPMYLREGQEDLALSQGNNIYLSAGDLTDEEKAYLINSGVGSRMF